MCFSGLPEIQRVLQEGERKQSNLAATSLLLHSQSLRVQVLRCFPYLTLWYHHFLADSGGKRDFQILPVILDEQICST